MFGMKNTRPTMPKTQDINVNVTVNVGESFSNQFHSINSKLDRLIMNQEQLVQELTALKEQSLKTNAEINAKLSELAAAIEAQGNVTPEVQAALGELKAVVQANDDLIADAPTEETPA